MKKYVKCAYDASEQTRVMENIKKEIKSILNDDSSDNFFMAESITQLLYCLVDLDQENVDFSNAYNNTLKSSDDIVKNIEQYLSDAKYRNNDRINY